MSKGASKVARSSVPVANRHGEGVLIDMHITPLQDVRGGHIAQLSGNLSALPVPDRHYTADICDVVYSRETVHILFGQERFGAIQGVRNLVVIKMTPAAIVGYLTTLAEPDRPSFDDAIRDLQIEAEVLTRVEEEPKETVVLRANVVLTAVVGREACMDFYYASPFSKSAAAHTRKLALDPVVRVDLRTGLLLGLHKAFRTIVSDLPEETITEGVPRGS